jgi:hypothetical protein
MADNPRLIRAERGIRRRLFLKALALGLSAPVAAKLASMATAAPSGPMKRFMVMYVPHGIAAEHFNPKMGADGVSFDLDQTNESILGPLQPYKQWVNVYQGLRYPDTGGTHEGIVNCLSGMETADGTTPRITVEHAIAKAIGAKPLILGACSHLPYGIDDHGKLFWDGTTHVDPQKSPVKVADTLFGGGTTTPTVSDTALRAKVLELNGAEVADLQKTVTGLTSEQDKLTGFLTGLEALRTGGGAGATACSGKPMLPTVEQVRTASAGIVIEPSGGNDYFYQEANFKLLLQAQLEVAAQALICGAARVVGLMPMYATCEFDFSFIGGTAPPGGWGHHNGLSHTQPMGMGGDTSPLSIVNAGPPAIRAPFAKAQRWFYEQLVNNLVSLLAKTPDPTASNGSMVLDNTLIYVMSEIGDGQNHNRVSIAVWPQIPAYLHAVTIGKAAGAIKASQVPTYPIDKDPKKGARPATDLYLTMAKAMGAADVTFPGTTGLITEVLT